MSAYRDGKAAKMRGLGQKVRNMQQDVRHWQIMPYHSSNCSPHLHATCGCLGANVGERRGGGGRGLRGKIGVSVERASWGNRTRTRPLA